jgi:TRAP-type C4-dicarboxylate transport system permease small subunit
MPRILYYFLIIAIALIVVNFLRSVWDRYRQRNVAHQFEGNANDPREEFPEKNPWEFPEKKD